jgi:hypothetical protein
MSLFSHIMTLLLIMLTEVLGWLCIICSQEPVLGWLCIICSQEPQFALFHFLVALLKNLVRYLEPAYQ